MKSTGDVKKIQNMKHCRHLTYHKGLVPFTLGFTPICVPCGDSSRPPPMSHSGAPPEDWRLAKREISRRANLAAIPLEEILSHPDLDVQGLLLSSFVLDIEWLEEYLNLRGGSMCHLIHCRIKTPHYPPWRRGGVCGSRGDSPRNTPMGDPP